MQALAVYAVIAITFVVIDGLWLALFAGPAYQAAIPEMLSASPNLFAAIAFYVLYPIGIALLAVAPTTAPSSLSGAAWRGAVLGAAAYGTYDLTNLAIMKDWPALLALTDWAWGTFVTGLAAIAGGLAARKWS